MKLMEAAKGYVLDRHAEGYSDRTLDGDMIVIRRLDAFLGCPDLDAITPDCLARYMLWLRDEYTPHRFSGDTSPLMPASLDRDWKAIHSFYKWAAKYLGVKRPDGQLPRPRYIPCQKTIFSEDEIRRILKACEGREFTRRNKAIVMTLLDTGLRVGELCRLKRQDVDLDTGEIVVIPFGSGRKSRSRSVWLSQSARRAVWLYLSGTSVEPEDSLFHMTALAVRLMLRRLGQRSGVPNVHPHALRDCFATWYIRNGGDVFTLQRLLGHSSLETVQIYVVLANTDDEQAHKTASPVARWKL